MTREYDSCEFCEDGGASIFAQFASQDPSSAMMPITRWCRRLLKNGRKLTEEAVSHQKRRKLTTQAFCYEDRNRLGHPSPIDINLAM